MIGRPLSGHTRRPGTDNAPSPANGRHCESWTQSHFGQRCHESDLGPGTAPTHAPAPHNTSGSAFKPDRRWRTFGSRRPVATTHARRRTANKRICFTTRQGACDASEGKEVLGLALIAAVQTAASTEPNIGVPMQRPTKPAEAAGRTGPVRRHRHDSVQYVFWDRPVDCITLVPGPVARQSDLRVCETNEVFGSRRSRAMSDLRVRSDVPHLCRWEMA